MDRKRFKALALAMTTGLAMAVETVASVASEDAVTYRTNIAHTAQNTMPDFVLPVQVKWNVNLGHATTYPLIAGGSVFVVTKNSTSNLLYALNAKNGNIVWGPVTLPLMQVAGLAYDNGMIFIAGIGLNYSVPAMMVGYDSTNGSRLWTTDLNGQWDYDAAPTAYQGYIYAQGGGDVSCVRESDGSIVWTAPPLHGDAGALAVTDDGIYLSSGCGNSYQLDPATGAVMWSFLTACSGGGGRTCAYYNGDVFIQDYYSGSATDPYSDAALDAITGKLVQSFPTTTPKAFDNGLMIGVPLSGASMMATKLTDWSTTWTASLSRGLFYTAPTIVNGVAYAATSTQLLNGYDENTGALVTSVPLNANPSMISESFTDLSAGDGLIVVPAGNNLVAIGTPFARMTATVDPASPNGSNGWYTKPVTVTLATTAGTAYYSLDGGAPQAYSAPFTVTGDARHTVTYWAEDSSGNITAKTPLPINIDGTVPKTSATLSGPQLVTGEYAGTTYVTLSASDNLSGVASTSYSVDGGASQAYSTYFTITGKGTHKVVYQSVDKAGNTETANTLTITLASPILHTFAAGLQMISATENYVGSTVSQIFDSPPALAAWSPASFSYAVAPAAPADTIRLGVGYWARVATGGTNLLDTGSRPDSTQPYSVVLNGGWNLIGDPFSTAVAVTALDAVSAAGTTYPVGGDGSIIAPTLYTWPAGATAYTPVQTTDALQPFVGYWIYAYQPCTLMIPETLNPSARPAESVSRVKH